MIYRTGDTLYFLCCYTIDGVASTPASAPTYVIYRLTDSLTVNTWASGNATYIGLAGYYAAKLPASTVDSDGLYFCCFTSTDAGVDQRDLTVAGFKGTAGVNNLDSAITSIDSSVWTHSARTLTSGSITPDDVWTHSARTLTTYPTNEIRLSTIDYNYYVDKEAHRDLYLYYGDSVDITYKVLSYKNNPVDLTDSTVTLYISTAEGTAPDITAIGIISSPLDGIVSINIDSATMSELDSSINYIGNIIVEWTDGRRKTIWKGHINIIPVVYSI